MAITLSLLNGFSKVFHCWKSRQVFNKNHTILPTMPSVCCHTALRKLEVRVLAYLEENADENITYFDFWTHTHTILVQLLYLLTWCSNFRFLLNIFFVNSRRFYLYKCCEQKQRFLHVWHVTDQTIIDNAIDEWHGRLRACVRAKRRTLRATIVTIISHMTRDFLCLSNVTRFLDCFFWRLPQFHTSIFRKGVRQHTEGTVGSIKCK